MANQGVTARGPKSCSSQLEISCFVDWTRWISATFSVLPATTTSSSRNNWKTVVRRCGSEHATNYARIPGLGQLVASMVPVEALMNKDDAPASMIRGGN